jgi:hypothetical protein
MADPESLIIPVNRDLKIYKILAIKDIRHEKIGHQTFCKTGA